MPPSGDLLNIRPVYCRESSVICRGRDSIRNTHRLSQGYPMEKKLASRPKKSLVRRMLAPLSLSLAVVGGGGWGAYHFTTHRGDEQASGIAHSAPSASDELKQLFSSSPPRNHDSAATSGRYASESSSARPDYNQALATPRPEPVKPTDRNELSVSKAPSVPGDSVTALLGNRYATVAVQTPPVLEPKPIAAEPQLAEEPAKEIKRDIARGQEPDGINPLRASVKNTEATIPSTPTPVASQQQDATASEMFGNSQPLAKKEATPPTGARYGAIPPVAAVPAIDYGPADKKTVASRNPAPAYDFQQQPAAVSQDINISADPSAPLNANVAGSTDITPTPGLTNTPGTGRPGEQLLEGVQSPSVTIHKLAPDEIQVGKRCTFAIRVQNTGQRTAQNVKIHDEVPLGTELVGTAPRAQVSGSQVVWDIGALSVGEQRTVELELIPTDEGELGSVATVSFSMQASAKAKCTRPELALRLSSKAQVHAGQNQVVQVEVSNPGTGDATNVMLLETVPTGVSHEAGPTVEFEVGTLRPGEARRMDLVLTAEQAGKITNVMTARADANLQVQASCEFEVIAPELQLTVDGPKKRYLERPATYHVSVDNPGTASAKEVELVTKLPKGLQFVSANNMGEYDSGRHSVHWSLAELPANERGTVELVALPIEVGEQTLQIETKARQGLQDRTEARVVVDGIVALMFEVVDVESPHRGRWRNDLRDSCDQPRLQVGEQCAGGCHHAARHAGDLGPRRVATCDSRRASCVRPLDATRAKG